MVVGRPGSQHTLAESVTLRGARRGDGPAPVPVAAAALDASLLAEGAVTQLWKRQQLHMQPSHRKHSSAPEMGVVGVCISQQSR